MKNKTFARIQTTLIRLPLSGLLLLLVSCGVSIFDWGGTPETEEEIYEAVKIELDKTDPDYDEALSLTEKLLEKNNNVFYLQLKAAILLGKGRYDIFTIVSNMVTGATSDTTSVGASSSGNNANAALRLYDDPQMAYILPNMVDSQSSSSSSSSSTSSSDSSVGSLMGLGNLLPDPTAENRAPLAAALAVLNTIDSADKTPAVTFQHTLISSLILTQALRSITAGFDLTNFDPSNVSPADMTDALNSINSVIASTAGEDNVFSESIGFVSDAMDKGGCTYTDTVSGDLKTATVNGIVETCELEACAVITGETGGCFL